MAKLHCKSLKHRVRQQDSLWLVYNDESLLLILHLAFERITIEIFVKHGREDHHLLGEQDPQLVC